MRITGGEFRGHKLQVPRKFVRPTQDRVREALFSILTGRIEGSRFLDLFAGTGSVGLDALSRGAEHVTWVEQNRGVMRILRENTQRYDSAKCQFVLSDSVKYFKNRLEEMNFDVIFADPPYGRGEGLSSKSVVGLQLMLDAIEKSDALVDDGLFVFEQRSREKPVQSECWDLISDRIYGESRLLFYKRNREKNDE